MRFLLFFLLLPTITFSQKIVWNKKDAFTGKTTIVTENLPLVVSGFSKLLQVSGSIEKDTTTVIYLLTFVTPVVVQIKLNQKIRFKRNVCLNQNLEKL